MSALLLAVLLWVDNPGPHDAVPIHDVELSACGPADSCNDVRGSRAVCAPEAGDTSRAARSSSPVPSAGTPAGFSSTPVLDSHSIRPNLQRTSPVDSNTLSSDRVPTTAPESPSAPSIPVHTRAMGSSVPSMGLLHTPSPESRTSSLGPGIQDTALACADAPSWHVRKIIASGAVGGIFIGSLIGSYFDWWKDSSQPFHFTDDGLFNNYSLGIDKIGHVYTSYFYFHTFRNVMQWGGYDEQTAFWWAAGISAFFALSIEIGDGLSPFGFSTWDLSFNMFGLGYGMAQTAVPFLQNFRLKWSYVPQEGYRWPPRFTEHYDAHMYWLTFSMHNLLPESARDWWPEFLQLAVGYGVDDKQTRRELMVGLDLNLNVFRTEQPEVRLLEQTVDLFHIPMPAVKFTQGKVPRYTVIGWN